MHPTSRISDYRNKSTRLVAGVMSGTSLDGVDVAFVEVEGTGASLRQRLVGFRCAPIDAAMRARILSASSGDMSVRDLFELDADLGELFATSIVDAAHAHSIPLDSIDAVGMHGQTVYHDPRRAPNGVTAQIGSAAIVAERVGSIVVNDFRTADVAAGGEGAPLVPYFDHVVFRSPSLDRIALNIGGIANVTWLSAGGDLSTLVAFDTGPGNMMIDAAMRHLYDRDFDADGAVAASGMVDDVWLEELLAHPYYTLTPPKSAGREQFGEEVGREHARRKVEEGSSPETIVATLTRLTARTIARGIVDHASRGMAVHEVIVGGGGAMNDTMMRMLREELPGTRVLPADELGVPADAKEAICFAVLANEALCETPANVPGVTGARRSVVCGSIRVPL